MKSVGKSQHTCTKKESMRKKSVLPVNSSAREACQNFIFVFKESHSVRIHLLSLYCRIKADVLYLQMAEVNLQSANGVWVDG